MAVVSYDEMRKKGQPFQLEDMGEAWQSPFVRAPGELGPLLRRWWS